MNDQHAPGAHVLGALPIFPLPNAVLLPGMVLPLNVFEPRYLALVDHALENGRHIGVPLLMPGFEEHYEGKPAVEEVFGIGCLMSHQKLPDGRRFIRLEGVGRVRALEELATDEPFRTVACEFLPEQDPTDAVPLEILKAQLERIASTLRPEDAQLVQSVLRIPEPRGLVYATAAIMPTLGVLPELPDQGRSSLLQMQQDCLGAETIDGRVHTLLETAASICTVLSDTGRFPRTVMN